jgi:hypothetical protein
MGRWANRRNRWQNGSNNMSRELQISNQDGICTSSSEADDRMKSRKFPSNDNREKIASVIGGNIHN